MEVGILVISLGKYDIYFEQLYKSFEKYFLPEKKKVYFYLNDSKKEILYKNVINCPISSKYRKWPLPTLFRYKFFISIKEIIKSTNVKYLYYTDIDMKAVNNIENEILPSIENPLIGVAHPGFWMRNLGTPEKRIISKACIKDDEKRDYYICGGIQGGLTDAFIKASEELNEMIDEDYNKGIIPIWNDESCHNRRYVSNLNEYKILSPSYCYPEETYINIKNGYSMLVKHKLVPRLIALKKNHKEMRI